VTGVSFQSTGSTAARQCSEDVVNIAERSGPSDEGKTASVIVVKIAFCRGGKMPRGVMPRRPAKTGRHEGARLKSSAIAVPTGPSKGPKVAAKSHRNSVSAKAPKKATPTVAKGGALKGYNPTSPERVAEILKRLDKLYPDVTCALTHKDPWELLVATILSAQSTDVRVNMVTPELFNKYPTVQDVAKLEPQQLEADIRSTGFFRNKSKSVVGAARRVVNEYGGKVPDTMEDLLTLPGVARKTANVVLGTWFKKAEGLVVDTHVHRISRRLELTKNDDPKKIEQDLMAVVPREKWILFSHQVIWHGRKLCLARSPKCVDCLLENICHAEDKTWSTVDRHKGARA
jgi:endonuclease III